MKYIILSIALILTTSWYLVSTNMAEKNQYTHFKVVGKVDGLRGNMVLKVEDNYLSLLPSARFSIITRIKVEEQLNVQIVEQPNNQYCQLSTSASNNTTLKLNIHCRATFPLKNNIIASL